VQLPSKKNPFDSKKMYIHLITLITMLYLSPLLTASPICYRESPESAFPASNCARLRSSISAISNLHHLVPAMPLDDRTALGKYLPNLKPWEESDAKRAIENAYVKWGCRMIRAEEGGMHAT
jgi:hypothetical protein